MSENFMRIRNGISLGSLTTDPSPATNGDFYYNSVSNTIRQYANGNWTSLGSGGSSSGSGKNYLSTYVASTSSNVANIGNGNFELGSTTGWSLAHSALSGVLPTSTATAGTAFSSTNGGTAANADLSLSLISSNQLSGLYSGGLASSAASTAGDLLISSAFYIDLEDQAKMMTIQFHYEAVSGTFNFSGTSSNTFAIWIYDVTNGAWIMPAGVYGTVQGSGVGYATNVTFQTTSNSTQYQLALININATSGAYSLYLDDFILGPQTAPSGPAMTDWIAYTPTGVQTGSITYQGYWRRVGDSMEINASAVFGGEPTGTFGIKLPSGYSVDITKIQSQADSAQGIAVGYIGSGASYTGTVRYFSSDSALEVEGPNNVARWDATIPGTFSSTANITINAIVPIIGWSSNTSMSSDTDTRVVAAQVNTTSGISITSSGTVLTFNQVLADTHGAYNTSTGIYTVPVSGYYRVTAGIITTSYSNVTELDHNGSYYARLIQQVSGQQGNGSATVKCSAGDTLSIKAYSSNSTDTTVADFTYAMFERLSGPAVIAATESVNAAYNTTSTSLPNNSDTTIVYSTKLKDTHAAYSTSTGLYTVPVSGVYKVTGAYSLDAIASGTYANRMYVVHNGTQIYTYYHDIDTNISSITFSMLITGEVSCLAGDTLNIQGFQASGSSYSLNIDNSAYICITRVGN